MKERHHSMTPVKEGNLITALDIGSSKISALIVEKRADNVLQVLGSGQRESLGVRRGYLFDMESTEKAVREAVEQAERIAGTNIESVWVSFSAGGLISDLSSTEVALNGQRIEEIHMETLLATGRDAIDPDGHMVLHAQPALYTLDGLKGVKSPIGLYADRLGVDIHVIAAEPSPVRNLELAVRSAHLEVQAIVAAPIAAGMSCLFAEERELGVALVELGAGVTNVSLFAGGLLVGLTSIPMGASDITDDIAAAFGTRRSDAERLKCFYGSAQSSPRDNHEMIDVAPIANDEDVIDPQRISRAQLIGVIRKRLDHWMDHIADALKSLGYNGPVGRQVVLTGGGAELKGIADYAQGVLGRSVRIGRPHGLVGLPDAHSGPAFATLTGLVLHAASEPFDLRPLSYNNRIGSQKSFMGSFKRLFQMFRREY
ncbi:cell division protein FtsA [Zymomonas mobilis subsp. mobilis ZM4 = ATCC 31821]|nr:cell division protein FtsA [Zymomonas mobilis]AVZ42102.2 cell division protein FtsA [Zymomonas mobilis subsp. mobilis ZM4 = ATCC 31821]UBQ08571.1 cell division protein FtsA [Zymomonas mobilis]HCE37583.1 cell division protein FtsA [Zymomonas mobilis]